MSKPLCFVCNPRKSKMLDSNKLDKLVYQSMMTCSTECETKFGQVSDGGGSPCCSMSSVINFNFNCAWTVAKNLKKKFPIQYFFMIHADVTCQPGAVDIMVSELKRTGADRIHALMPFKDERCMSQVALGREDMPRDRVSTGEWIPRRLTMSECLSLPKTFSAKDTDMPDRVLLADNGLWLCDFTKPWVDQMNPDDISCKFHFFTRDGIFLQPDGNYKAELLGEDYAASYLLHDMGGKSVVTRKVFCQHWDGENAYPNNELWGKKMKRDEEFFSGVHPGCTPA